MKLFYENIVKLKTVTNYTIFFTDQSLDGNFINTHHFC